MCGISTTVSFVLDHHGACQFSKRWLSQDVFRLQWFTGHGSGGGQRLIPFIDLYKNDSRHREITGSRQGMHATGTLQHNDFLFFQAPSPSTVFTTIIEIPLRPLNCSLPLCSIFSAMSHQERWNQSWVYCFWEGQGFFKNEIPSPDTYEAICQ